MRSKIAVLMSRSQFFPPWRMEGLRFPPPFLLCLLPCLLFFLIAPSTTAVDYTADCSGGTNDSSASFDSGLRSLLSSLASLSSTSNAGTSTAGAANGLYMCQGDLSPSACSSCVRTAVTDISQACAGRPSGIIWYELCELRYSDTDFFGVPVTEGHSTSNPLDETSSVKPFEVVSALAQVAPLSRPLMFASNISDMYPLFAQAQCSSDLSADGCGKCLTAILELVKVCCTQRKGWRYFTPSCWVRYEPTPFIFGDYPNATNPYIVRSHCSSTNFLSSTVVAEQANLRSLFSELKSKAPSTGFYSTSVETDSGELYGLALCSGDLATPSKECGDCLETAGRAIMDECPNKTEGYMWYGRCFLRYSEQSFFGVLDYDDNTFCGKSSTDQVTDDMTVRKAQSLVQAAATNPLLFAAGKVAIDNTTSSYLLLQCTRDLSSQSCQLCLDGGISKMSTSCKQTKGWQYLSGSCTIRYEAFLFFNETAAARAMELPPTPANPEGRSHSKVRIIAILLPISGVVLLGLLFCCSRNFRRRKGGRKSKLDDFRSIRGRDLTFIDLPVIQAATNSFSDENKLGEGGFGPVYKGVLQDGTEIAVKRLSQESNQGATEFKNEMKLIAKIQHKNLVRMLGCCAEGGEKLLIYEYLPNKSLDSFLFDPNKRVQLNWERRFLIISGITKGLLYLHEDSLLKVIHRDVKSSNVLLDNQMNPKISDFGMAKIFATEEAIEANTRRIVGTYGYMAPEYAMYGIFSVKSDVFSYGVLLLEIISGEKNGTGHFDQHGKTLLRRAWDLWKENKAAELIDQALVLENASSDVEAAVKCIHIGLLCVQENAEERPTMSAVILMLRTDGMALPEPGRPPDFAKKGLRSDEPLHNSSTTPSLRSINEVTETNVIPR